VPPPFAKEALLSSALFEKEGGTCAKAQ